MLPRAARMGDVVALRRLIYEDKVAVDVRDADYDTALLKATRQGHARAVELLLEAGATATKEDVEGKSAIDYADSAGFDDVVAVLADYASRDPNTAGMLQSSAGAMTERLQQVENQGSASARNSARGHAQTREASNATRCTLGRASPVV